MPEPVRPVVDGSDPLDADPLRPRRGPIDPALLRLAPALRRHLLVCGVLAVVSTFVVLAQAEALGRLLPRLIDGDLGAAVPLATALAAVAFTRFAASWVTEVSSASAEADTRRSITDRVVSHALVLDERGAAEVTPARVTTVVTDGVDALGPWIRSYVPALCLAGILPLAAGARILLADIPSAVVLLVAIPLIPVFMVLIGRLAEDRADRQWATLQRLAGHFHEVLVGIPTLRLFGRAEDQVGRVRAVAEQYRAAVMRTLKVAFLSAATMELLAMLSVALVAVTIGYRLTVGEVSLSTALVVLVLAPECSLPIRRVGAAFHAAQAGTDAADELQEILRAPSTPDGPVWTPSGAGATSPAGPPSVSFDGVVVTDPVRGRRVGPVDAAVGPGSIVALVGPSGAGKSTLLDVVRGRVPLHRGSVRIGGTEVGDLSRASRADAIAWVPQLPEPVGTDVRAAVEAGTGADPGTVDEILGSLDLATSADLDPSTLSGGERQRVAVARAVVAARPRAGAPAVRVLLADEPTSHVDEDRTAMVIGALRAVASTGAAVLVATHDPRVIAAADDVVVLAAPAVPEAVSRRAADPAPGADPTPTGAGFEPADPGPPDQGSGDHRWFGRVPGPIRLRLWAGRAMGTATEACTIGLAGTAAWLVVRASQGPSFADLAVAAVAVRVFGLSKGVLRYVERLVSHDAVFRLLAEVRGDVVARLGRIAPAGVAGMERGDVMSRVVEDVDRLGDQELRVTAPLVSATTVACLVVVLAAALGGVAVGAAYAVAVVLVGIGVPIAARSLTADAVERQSGERAQLAGATMELLEHGDELASCGAATAWTSRIDAALGRSAHEQRRRGLRIGALEGAAAAAAPLLAGAVVLVDRAEGAVIPGAVLGVAVLVPFALMEILVPLAAAGTQQVAVNTASRRLRAVMEAPEPVVDPAEPRPVPSPPVVRFDDVSLRWPRRDHDVVTGLDLELAPGDRLRIVGPSGSGKSTVAAALVRFIDVRSGRYSIGGVGVDEFGGDQVRSVVTWCQQSPWLAATTLRENLLIAAPGATDEQLWRALDAVRLSEWVEALPDGMSTAVGRDGAAMSGGQRQRLALARVLLADHRVVVLDEPTAHLDRPTAAAVVGDLLTALDDRAVLLLGHGDPDRDARDAYGDDRVGGSEQSPPALPPMRTLAVGDRTRPGPGRPSAPER